MRINSTPIIPKPVDCQILPGKFTIHQNYLLQSDTSLPAEQISVLLALLNRHLPEACDTKYQPTPNGHAANLLISIDPDICDAAAEASILQINQEHIQITASDTAGAFYAMQNLAQFFMKK